MKITMWLNSIYGCVQCVMLDSHQKKKQIYAISLNYHDEENKAVLSLKIHTLELKNGNIEEYDKGVGNEKYCCLVLKLARNEHWTGNSVGTIYLLTWPHV